jgi:integrase/recombinase XerD
VDAVRRFLDGRAGGDKVDLVGLSAGDVTGFVLVACPGRATGSAKMTVSALRSLLNYLHVEGLIPASPVGAVPSVSGRSDRGVPKGLAPDQVRGLLPTCDRRRRVGRRDYRVLLLLSRLGLRAGEVAVLGLDDIDLRARQIAVRRRGNRVERLPLPADVGEAIAGYLCRGRPATAQGRSVFVRVKAPHRGW